MKYLTLLGATLLFCSSLCAQTTDESNPFAAGTYNLTLNGAWSTPIRFSQANLYNFNLAVGKYFWNNNQIAVEFQGYYADQPHDDDALIGGIGLLGRWHFLRFDRWSIFLDGGGGVTYGDHIFPTYPYDGTHFNFTGKVGLGATYQIKDHEFLMAGVRYFHLSNGDIHRRDENPTYDSVQIWGGWMWTW